MNGDIGGATFDNINSKLIDDLRVQLRKGNVDGILLYVKTQEDIVPDDMMQLKDGNAIYFRTHDLNQEFDGICKRLDYLIEN